ncbi:unnamed protein product [Closterium sp. Yama58-4]|nr:unnamed protein product [Closterium sp. Yama58-4]
MLTILTARKAIYNSEDNQINLKKWVAPFIAANDGVTFKDPALEAPPDIILRMARLALSCTTMPTALRPNLIKVLAELEALREEVCGATRNRMARRIDREIDDAKGHSLEEEVANAIRIGPPSHHSHLHSRRPSYISSDCPLRCLRARPESASRPPSFLPSSCPIRCLRARPESPLVVLAISLPCAQFVAFALVPNRLLVALPFSHPNAQFVADALVFSRPSSLLSHEPPQFSSFCRALCKSLSRRHYSLLLLSITSSPSHTRLKLRSRRPFSLRVGHLVASAHASNRPPVALPISLHIAHLVALLVPAHITHLVALSLASNRRDRLAISSPIPSPCPSPSPSPTPCPIPSRRPHISFHLSSLHFLPPLSIALTFSPTFPPS